MKSARALIVGSLMALTALAQTPADERFTYGIVSNALTGEPVKNALVFLIHEPPAAKVGAVTGSEEPRPDAILTGPAGEFRFNGLPDGRYTLDVTRSGLDQKDLPVVTIPRQSANSSLQIELEPLGRIEGSVINQYDEPLERICITLYRIETIDGRKTVRENGSVWTNGHGKFHLSLINPGKFYLKASGRVGGTEVHAGLGGARYAPFEGFTPTYFGGAAEIDSASPITITPGSVIRADFRIDARPAFRIRGKLEGYLPDPPVTFELLEQDAVSHIARALFDPATGEFQILDVIPGSYRVRVEQENARGEAVVNVSRSDAAVTSIALKPPVPVGLSVAGFGGGCGVLLGEKWSPNFKAISAPGEKGGFSNDGMFPGEYWVSFICSGGYPISASFGPHDLLTANPVISLPSGGPLPPLEVVYRPGGGTLKVTSVRQSPEEGVLLVPAFWPSIGPQAQPDAKRSSLRQMSKEGFTFRNLAPGEYTVYRLQDIRDAEYRNPDFLRSLSGGATVHIEDGKISELDIPGGTK